MPADAGLYRHADAADWAVTEPEVAPWRSTRRPSSFGASIAVICSASSEIKRAMLGPTSRAELLQASDEHHGEDNERRAKIVD
jgi:hypothetical protein